MKSVIFSFIIGGLLLWATPAHADIVGDSRTEYVEESHVLRKGNEVTIVKLSLEWPVKLDGNCLVELQRELCAALFKNTGRTLYEGLRFFVGQFGKEIERLPDEQGLQLKYLSVSSRLLAWQPERLLSMYLLATARDSEHLEYGEVRQHLLTYDIAHDKVLKSRDLLKRSCYPDHVDHEQFLDAIEHYMGNISGVVEGDSLPDEVCLLSHRQGMALNLKGSNGPKGIDDLMVMPFSAARFFIKSQPLRLIENELELSKRNQAIIAARSSVLDSIVHEQHEWPDVCLVADTMPQFVGGNAALANYLALHLNYPPTEEALQLEGKVVVSFVVDEQGHVCHPVVIQPVAPGLDREAVRVVMEMPRWEPGRIAGQPRKVRMRIPVKFRIQK